MIMPKIRGTLVYPQGSHFQNGVTLVFDTFSPGSFVLTFIQSEWTGLRVKESGLDPALVIASLPSLPRRIQYMKRQAVASMCKAALMAKFRAKSLYEEVRSSSLSNRAILVQVFEIPWTSESNMLSLELVLLVASAVEALVALAPPPNLSPDMAQGSAGDDFPLELLSSALLENTSFATTTATLPVANSSLASNHSLSAGALVRCDDMLGRDMNLDSCDSAFYTIDRFDMKQYSWGPRGTGVGYDFPLPRRWVSCELLTSALPYEKCSWLMRS